MLYSGRPNTDLFLKYAADGPFFLRQPIPLPEGSWEECLLPYVFVAESDIKLFVLFSPLTCWCWSDTLKGDHFSIDVASLVLQGIVTSFCGHSLPASCEHLIFLGLNFMSHHLSQSSSASMPFLRASTSLFSRQVVNIGKEEAGAKD